MATMIVSHKFRQLFNQSIPPAVHLAVVLQRYRGSVGDAHGWTSRSSHWIG